MNNQYLLANENKKNKISEWGQEALISLGYTLKHNLPDTVQHTPYSYVLRYETTNGAIYLKHTPSKIGLEAKIIKILQDKFKAPVPQIIADDATLNCFLMKDAGTSLRSILKKQFDVVVLCKAVEKFTSLQLTISDHVNVLIDIGVPDWSLDKMPSIYKEIVSEKAFLIEDGMSDLEINSLEKLYPLVLNLCKKVSAFNINPTIVQPDFNDNNTLLNDKSGTITIIDLGEIAISHPFFSIINFLHVIKKHHSLNEKDDMFLKIKVECFKKFMTIESEKNILEAFDITQTLWIVYSLLASYRLMHACGIEKYMEFQRGKLSNILREFICDGYV